MHPIQCAQVPDWISYSRESTEAYRSASRMAALSHDKMVATLTMYLPDHDINGCVIIVCYRALDVTTPRFSLLVVRYFFAGF